MSTREAAPDIALQAARDAAARRAWGDAYDLFASAGAPDGLAAEDLELFADAAWWIGRIPECMEARERAYAAYVAAGNRRRAAWCALWQYRDHEHRLAGAQAAGWFARVERLLDAEPEAPEHGWLERARRAIARGDLDAGLAHATRTLEIGDRFGDRDGDHLLQRHHDVPRPRRLRARRRLDRRGEALVRAPGDHGVPRHVPRLPCRDHAPARRVGRGRRRGAARHR